MEGSNSFLGAGVSKKRFLYQGKEWQTELGLNLYDFHARQFDPALGRFITNDLANQFMSPYHDMANMPTIGIDPDGRLAWFVPLIIGGVLNLGVQAAANNVHSFWDGLGAFAVGSASTAISMGVSNGLGTGMSFAKMVLPLRRDLRLVSRLYSLEKDSNLPIQ